MTDQIIDTINFLCSKIKEAETDDEKQSLISALKALLDIYFDSATTKPSTRPKIPSIYEPIITPFIVYG